MHKIIEPTFRILHPQTNGSLYELCEWENVYFTGVGQVAHILVETSEAQQPLAALHSKVLAGLPLMVRALESQSWNITEN